MVAALHPTAASEPPPAIRQPGDYRQALPAMVLALLRRAPA